MIPTIQQLQLANSDYIELRNFIKNKDFMKFLIDNTNFLSSATTKQRLWHLLNNMHIQYCICGKQVNWNIKNNSYRFFCSSKCAHNSDTVKDKIVATCIKKYGKKTYLITDTAKTNYQEKMIEKFGVNNPFLSKIVQDDIKDTILVKYGVTNISYLQETKDKITSIHQKKYSRIRQCQSHFSDESYFVKYNKLELVELYKPGVSIKDIANKLNIGHTQLCIQFKNFGIDIHPNVGQQQVFDFIKSIYSGTILLNDRKVLDGKEIDIYLPELNIGIEYDGIFWHSENSSGKVNYHIEKDVLAKSKGIKLYHILDLEWKDKQELVKSRISSFVGVNTTLYGRKTVISILDKKDAIKFFKDNHIQGNTGASFYVGLKHDNQIVAAMSFGKSRYNNYQYELLRFCNLKNINVVGGASKMFKFAINNLGASDIVSFCDLRWGTGTVYEKLGFKHIRNNGASYSYTHNYRTFESRIKYQKHKLANILTNFDPELSEWDNMKNNEFDRYWNSGNAVYVWTKL